MDLIKSPASSNIFDEERRKDRTIIVQLQERVDSLSREVEARTRYAHSLETTINEVRVQLPKAMIWTTAVEQVRNEFNAIIERIEDQRVKTERESMRVRQVEIESLVRQINELKREVKPYGKYSEDIEARKIEEGRCPNDRSHPSAATWTWRAASTRPVHRLPTWKSNAAKIPSALSRL